MMGGRDSGGHRTVYSEVVASSPWVKSCRVNGDVYVMRSVTEVVNFQSIPIKC